MKEGEREGWTKVAHKDIEETAVITEVDTSSAGWVGCQDTSLTQFL